VGLGSHRRYFCLDVFSIFLQGDILSCRKVFLALKRQNTLLSFPVACDSLATRYRI